MDRVTIAPRVNSLMVIRKEAMYKAYAGGGNPDTTTSYAL